MSKNPRPGPVQDCEAWTPIDQFPFRWFVKENFVMVRSSVSMG